MKLDNRQLHLHTPCRGEAANPKSTRHPHLVEPLTYIVAYLTLLNIEPGLTWLLT